MACGPSPGAGAYTSRGNIRPEVECSVSACGGQVTETVDAGELQGNTTECKHEVFKRFGPNNVSIRRRGSGVNQQGSYRRPGLLNEVIRQAEALKIRKCSYQCLEAAIAGKVGVRAEEMNFKEYGTHFMSLVKEGQGTLEVGRNANLAGIFLD
ncbi:hypothetical protein BD779DRAFT_1465162 [Infundibulicybe gibba]|nr:hypothetical protein BD779DRAFT_1465162 [Infundibulicybe gibba]